MNSKSHSASSQASESQPSTSNSSPGNTSRDSLSSRGPVQAPNARDLGWQILEKFSRVTRTTKQTAGQILDHPLARPFRPLLPKEIQHLSTSYVPATRGETVLDQMLLEMPAAADYVRTWLMGGRPQYDSVPFSTREMEVWHETIEEGECGDFEVLSTSLSLPEPVSKRSPSYILTKQLWEKYQKYDFTRSFPIFNNDETNSAPKEQVDGQAEFEGELSHPTSVIQEIRMRIFRGGIEEEIRCHVWKFLLGYLPWGTTLEEQTQLIETKIDQYQRFKDAWTHMSSESVPPAAWEEWKDRKHLIIKDVIRTDRHHPFFVPQSPISNQEEEEILLAFTSSVSSSSTRQELAKVNPNLTKLAMILMTYVQYLNEVGRSEMGYVQGMSDLCSGLLVLYDGHETDTFWCFVGLMERLHPNFHQDQSAMHSQLTTLKSLVQFVDFSLFKHLSQCDALNMFFAYRWLLVWFKREFHLPDILAIWEICLCDVLCPEYPLFIALALLDFYRKDIVQFTQFDQILKFVNELAYKVNPEVILDRAEIVFQMYRNKMTIVNQMRGLFPEMDVELCKKLAYLDLERSFITNSLEAI